MSIIGSDKHWSDEANQFEEQKLYTALDEIAPKQCVLEIGCGNGLGTKRLASDREVLVIDNNRYLLQKAKENNSSNPNTVSFTLLRSHDTVLVLVSFLSLLY